MLSAACSELLPLTFPQNNPRDFGSWELCELGGCEGAMGRSVEGAGGFFLPFKSHPFHCLHSIFYELICTFKFSSVVSWLSRVPNQNSCSIQLVLQGCPWQLALTGSWREAWAAAFLCWLSPNISCRPPCPNCPFPCPWTSSLCPNSRALPAGLQPHELPSGEVCRNFFPPLPPSWPELLPTPSLIQISQEGALWSSAEKASLQ